MKFASLTSGLAVLAIAFAGAMAQAEEIAVVSEARDALPDDIRDAGVLNIATSLQWAPFGFTDESGEPEGIDLQLMTLLAAKLGLEAQFNDIKFPSIVPGVQTGRYDAGVNQMGITAERSEVVSFVPYFNSKYGLLVPAGKSDTDINDLCGLKLALTQGSSQIAIAEELSAKCEADGKTPIAMDFYPNSADTYMAVANGRGDGFLTARAVGVYTAQHNDKLEMTDGILDGRSSISGIVVGKDDAALQNALTLALVSAINDGTYAKILDNFGVPEGILTVEQVETPPSF
ncbi:ABC-transporter arginine-binding protein precursor (plasmid) [Paracoccaceae bacterium]|nr:ABC-transporter arginine-binding protein precursor [Paracoccaceae bacterium]